MAPHPPQRSGRPGEAVAPLDRVAVAIATLGGVGWAPVAPGTVASALTIVALWLLALSPVALVAVLIGVTLIGGWAAHHAERALGRKDPGAIVIDEVAGMTLSVLFVPLTVPVAVLAFALFRVFDVVKPSPARQAQALPGGAGVMVDDLIAGLYALVVVVALRALVGGF
jgi:phosphatidylglycerophosphatase A